MKVKETIGKFVELLIVLVTIKFVAYFFGGGDEIEEIYHVILFSSILIISYQLDILEKLRKRDN